VQTQTLYGMQCTHWLHQAIGVEVVATPWPVWW
jgi:hypothetical protein